MSSRHEQIVDVPGGWCFTVLDQPQTSPRAVVVCAHGLTGDRSGPAELLSGWASMLVARRIAVLRFDFRGSGESSGDWIDTTFEAMISDQVAVASWIRQIFGPVPLLMAGISIGGVPAALAAPRLDASGVLLMSSDLIEGVQFDVRGCTPIRSGEFHLPDRFFRERERLYPRTAMGSWGKPWGLIYGSLDDKVRKSAADLANLGCWTREVQGTDHLFESESARAALAGHSLGLVDLLLARPGPSSSDPQGA